MTRTLLLGGVRSGKSSYAEQLMTQFPVVTYVATGQEDPNDPNWQQRITRHRQRRPAYWNTIETIDLVTVLPAADTPLLIDCLGGWLNGQFQQHDAWETQDNSPVEAAITELIAAWQACQQPVVAVSNEVGMGVVPANYAARIFSELLGWLNTQIAQVSEQVIMMTAGIPQCMKGEIDAHNTVS